MAILENLNRFIPDLAQVAGVAAIGRLSFSRHPAGFRRGPLAAQFRVQV